MSKARAPAPAEFDTVFGLNRCTSRYMARLPVARRPGTPALCATFGLRQMGIKGSQGMRQSLHMVGLIDINDAGADTATGGEAFLGVHKTLASAGRTDGGQTSRRTKPSASAWATLATPAANLRVPGTAYWDWVSCGIEHEDRQQLPIWRWFHDKLMRQIELGAVDRLAGLETNIASSIARHGS